MATHLLTIQKRVARLTRHRRTRARIRGTAARPRVTVFRGTLRFDAQLIDDVAGTTLVAVSDRTQKLSGTKRERAKALGEILAAQAKKAGITRVVFDKSGYAYHGRVAAFADGARQGGLTF